MMYIVDFKTPVISLEKKDYDLEELSKKINTSIEDIIHKPHWYKIDGEWYYFKSMDRLERYINEILGSMFAKKHNLPTATYEVAGLDKGNYTIYGLISKNFKLENKEYTTVFDLKLPVYDNKLYNLVMIREYFKNEDDYYRFIVSMLKLTAIDYYMNQIDRVNENLLLIKEPEHIELAPVFDYSISMDIGKRKKCAHFDDIAGCYTFNYKENDSQIKQRYGSAFLELFFPSDEMKRLFRDYPEFYETMKSFLEFDIEDMIEEIEDKYPLVLPDYLKKHYQQYDKEKKQFIKKLI